MHPLKNNIDVIQCVYIGLPIILYAVVKDCGFNYTAKVLEIHCHEAVLIYKQSKNVALDRGLSPDNSKQDSQLSSKSPGVKIKCCEITILQRGGWVQVLTRGKNFSRSWVRIEPGMRANIWAGVTDTSGANELFPLK